MKNIEKALSSRGDTANLSPTFDGVVVAIKDSIEGKGADLDAIGRYYDKIDQSLGYPEGSSTVKAEQIKSLVKKASTGKGLGELSIAEQAELSAFLGKLETESARGVDALFAVKRAEIKAKQDVVMQELGENLPGLDSAKEWGRTSAPITALELGRDLGKAITWGIYWNGHLSSHIEWLSGSLGSKAVEVMVTDVRRAKSRMYNTAGEIESTLESFLLDRGLSARDLYELSSAAKGNVEPMEGKGSFSFNPVTKGDFAIKEYNIGDAVTKALARMKVKKISGEPKSKSVRTNLEVEAHGIDFVNFMNRIKRHTARIGESEGVYIKGEDLSFQGAGEDMGHAISLEVMSRYPGLFKNSNAKSLQTLVYQDPKVNRDILVQGKFQGKQEKIFQKLNEYVGQKVTPDNIKALNNLRIDLDNINKDIITAIKNAAKKNAYFKGQEKRIPAIKLSKLKIGDTFKSTDIVVDMSGVNDLFQVGEISKNNKNAKKFNQLSKEEKEVYRTNILNQRVETLEKFYTTGKKPLFSKDAMRDLKEAFEYGTYERSPAYRSGGLTGVDQYILNRHK